MNKYKFILWKTLVIIALVNIAILDILLVVMFQTHITPDMQQKKGVVVVSLLCGVILRIIKPYKLLFPLIIVLDLILICIAILESGFADKTFIKTLSNLVSDPASLLILITIVVFAFDWKLRYGKMQAARIEPI